MSLTASKPVGSSGRKLPAYGISSDGAFLIEHFDAGPAFSSFLPGIAGLDGTPLWCLYVNRGQAIASFGVHNKDNAIVEFLPANWAYELVGVQGFRTFCRVDGEFFEPFGSLGPVPGDEVRSMCISPDRVVISATNMARGLRCEVEYYSPPECAVGALVRHVTLTNIGAAPVRLAALDGLPLILPAGIPDYTLKAQRHITAAYAYVRKLSDDVPYFATKVAVHDEAEVSRVTSCNFYAAWVVRDASLRPVQPVIDPQVVFGAGQSLASPRRFIEGDGLQLDEQLWENRLACALAPVESALSPDQSIELYALVGSAPTPELARRFVDSFTTVDDFVRAREASARTVAAVTAPAKTVSGQPIFDAYAEQNFLDNALRGGVPVALPSKDGTTLLHAYARRHGDLERDYNFFVLPPHPLSSGAGNYRDICQNRRWDTLFYPEVRDLELRSFLELIQADGFNPLSVEGYSWTIGEEKVESFAPAGLTGEQLSEFRRLITRPFQPGAVLRWLDLHDISVGDRMSWLQGLLGQGDRQQVARDHSGGYWIDHWTYLVDLLESVAAVYPDELEEMLTERANVGWFDDGAFVQPRSAKYKRRSAGLRQLDAVAERSPRTVPLPAVTPLGKLTVLVAIKALSFDANCRGIEMEAGRPGWNDAMNGLPGLFGSSICETLALGRLAAWLSDHLPKLPEVVLPRPCAEFVGRAVEHLAAGHFDWSAESASREAYREAVSRDSDTATSVVSGEDVARLLRLVTARVHDAAARATDGDNALIDTYYRNAPTVETEEPAAAIPDASEALPLFLEGQVHRLRLVKDAAEARRIYQAVRNSPLFDRELAMYKLNASLAACGPEIGRAHTFTPGWFENESVWLHMSYKYLLELLRAGLHDEFFRDAETMLVPFMDPQTYGRSTLENSSFIGSSVNPDRDTHGRGFIARLSGSTAEFIHMWLLLTMGPRPFRVGADGRLTFGVEPVLPGHWFTTEATSIRWADVDQSIPANGFGCALLGDGLLVYHNETRRDTFGPDGVRPVKYQFDGNEVVDAAHLEADHAMRLRSRAIRRMDVWLA